MNHESDFLGQMARSSAARVAEAGRIRPLDSIARAAHASPAPPRLKLSGRGFDLIMELKLSSPANGLLASADLDVGAQVERYARAGAAVVSVLTEPDRFHGSLADLGRAVSVLAPFGIPAMRKDFLVDAYQLYEARLCGAGGVLLICRMLDDTRLAELVELAAELGLFVLLETFDEQDIGRAAAIASRWSASPAELLVGVNSRDLVTLKVVPERLQVLAPLLPADHPRVAESGLVDAGDAARLAGAGYTLALVGTALMSAPDPIELGAQMLAAGRAASARTGPT